jgi:putative redox protein
MMVLHRTSRHSVVAAPAGGERITAWVREHAVPMDQPVKAGGTDGAPTPLELLSVSLAGCIALYANRFCESEGLEAEGLGVEVKPFWRENPGRIARFDVVLHLPPGFPEAYRIRLEEVARKCPVHHTLTHAPEVTLQLRESGSEAVAG